MQTFADALDAFDARCLPWGPPTGLAQLDELTGGMVPGQVWVVLGAPGQGRTTLLLHLAARWIAASPNRVILDCPREPTPQLVAKLLAHKGRLSLRGVSRGENLTDERLSAARHALAESGLVLGGDERPSSLTRLEHLLQHSPAAFLVDDLDVGDGAAPDALLNLAHEGAFVCVTLPRHLVAPTPELESDLEPAWARAADVILEVRTLNLPGSPSGERAGEAEISILKNRHGPLYTAVVGFQGHYSRFYDLR